MMTAREKRLEILIRRLASATKRMRIVQRGATCVKPSYTQSDRVKAEQETDTILQSIESELIADYGTTS